MFDANGQQTRFGDQLMNNAEWLIIQKCVVVGNLRRSERIFPRIDPECLFDDSITRSKAL